jgi:hypothetical protein
MPQGPGGVFPSSEDTVTFKTILDDAAERLQSSGPEARTRFRRYLNEWHKRIVSKASLLRGETNESISVVAATDEYTLPAGVSRVRSIRDATNGRVLHERTLEWIRRQDPQADTTGTPDCYAYVSNRVIKLYPIPAANNTLYVDHNSTVDDLDEDTDVPLIPEDFHYLLSLGIRINEYEKNTDSRLREARIDMSIGIADLKFDLANRLSNVSNPARNRPDSSRLGGWYPRGS